MYFSAMGDLGKVSFKKVTKKALVPSKKILKPAAKILGPVAATVAAPYTGGASIAAYGAAKKAGKVKKVKKGAPRIKPAKLTKAQKREKKANKKASLAVGSSGTAAEMAVAAQSGATGQSVTSSQFVQSGGSARGRHPDQVLHKKSKKIAEALRTGASGGAAEIAVAQSQGADSYAPSADSGESAASMASGRVESASAEGGGMSTPVILVIGAAAVGALFLLKKRR